ncbi:MnhB domain-containing protein [Halocatena halophila]|uniref:MnhB domain-containing protein n=1 Tax=Halocatena halophila TaxID=2814576 RepID=UPI002ED37FAC
MSSNNQTTVIVRTVVRSVVPIIVLVAIGLLLQGHNFPGGGFIGGVLTVTAFALVYITYGAEYLSQNLLGISDGSVARRETQDVLDPDEAFFSGTVGRYSAVFGLGLALAAGGGLGAIAFGEPFLSQAVLYFDHIPVFGVIELASALIFDLGVYFVVVGSLLTILAVVGNE